MRIRAGIGDHPLALIALAAATASVAAYELAQGARMHAVALCVLPIFALMLTRPAALLVPLGACLPLLHSFVVAGTLVTLSDLLLTFVFVGVLLQALVNGETRPFAALRPVAFPLAVYAGAMVVVFSAHVGLTGLVQTGQRFELFLFPLVVGAFAALSGRVTPMLQAYVVAATLLAVAWPLDLLSGQKNPVGQLIGNAILLLVGVPALRRLLPCLVVLVPMLLVTQSRGAILATIVGVIVITGMQGSRTRLTLVRIGALMGIGAIAFILLPSATRDRITTLSASTSTRAGYAIEFRQQFATDAWTIIHAHPWTGVGVGNYLGGRAGEDTQSNDPHQVLLLQAAEGGYGLAAGFIALLSGSLLALYRMRRLELAPAAAGILIATFVHGLVDVYWVRVTPVLSWLVVGMVCGLYARQRDDADAV